HLIEAGLCLVRRGRNDLFPVHRQSATHLRLGRRRRGGRGCGSRRRTHPWFARGGALHGPCSWGHQTLGRGRRRRCGGCDRSGWCAFPGRDALNVEEKPNQIKAEDEHTDRNQKRKQRWPPGWLTTNYWQRCGRRRLLQIRVTVDADFARRLKCIEIRRDVDV